MKLRPDQLDAIKRHIVAVARDIRKDGTEVKEALVVIERRGSEIGNVIAHSLVGIDKSQWVPLQRRVAQQPDIAAVALVGEAWISAVKPDETDIPTTTAGRERDEVFMLNLMTAEDQWLMHAPISRNYIHDAPLDKLGDGPGTWAGRFVREQGAPR